MGSQEWRRQDRLIAIIGIVVFALEGLLLCRFSSLTDSLQAAQQAAVSFWGAVFFLFWYPFGTASLAARIWLEHKKMELRLHDSERHDAENRTEAPSSPTGP